MTVTTANPPVSPALSIDERQRWTVYYEDHLREQLKRTVDHVRGARPSELNDHLDSVLTLLRRTRPRPELHPLAIELIVALHPWPLRWMRWEAWEREIRFAVQIYADLGQPGRQAEFLGHLADVLFNTGRLDEALAVGEEAIVLARTHQAVTPLAVAGRVVIHTLRQRGRQAEARRLLQDLLTQVSDARGASVRDRTLALARLRLQRLTFLRRDDRLEEAISEASGIVAQMEALPETDEHLLAEAYRDLSTMEWAAGYYARAVGNIKRAIKMFVELGDEFAETEARGNLGLIYWTMTELDLAEKNIRHVVSMAERLHAHWHLTYALGNLGLVYLLRGQFREAMPYFNRAIEVSQRLGDIKEVHRNKINRAVAKQHLGDYETAVADLEAGLAFFEEQGLSEPMMMAYIRLSRCCADLGHEERALQLAEEAMEIAQQVGAHFMQVEALCCLAERRPEQGVDLLRRALSLVRQIQRPLYEGACLLSLAGLTEDEEEQMNLWSQGVQFLEDAGATAWLEDASPSNPPRVAM